MLSEKDMEDSSHFFLVTLTILLTAQIFDLSNKPPEIRADDRRGGRRHMKDDSNISATESDQTDNTPLRGGETKAILIDRQTRCPPTSLNECSKILLSRIGLAGPKGLLHIKCDGGG